jgi:DNA-binding MarR family transcriptional regulator
VVRRSADPDDRRAIKIHLTPKGDRLATQALDAVLAVDEEILTPLTDPQRRQLAATLKRLLLPLEEG